MLAAVGVSSRLSRESALRERAWRAIVCVVHGGTCFSCAGRAVRVARSIARTDLSCSDKCPPSRPLVAWPANLERTRDGAACDISESYKGIEATQISIA